ncbi:chemotaxis protein CheB [Zavarzinia sp.]|uniref:chemotaxis protein CheB n=1 Tax=Zavarzinia sp. TaxID=2027920 RepID=UPI003BB57B96
MSGNHPHRDRTARGQARRRAAMPVSNPEADILVVGIGASAGGLEACRKLLDALPDSPGMGMALILVQHLDPTHDSMLVDLLAASTAMPVRQAIDGMRIESDHLYVIPPGTYLSVGEGLLHLSRPRARHGARMPFDFLLQSLATAYGARAACVILSGTGADGSLGLEAVGKAGGLVIAQSPSEAGYDGMPRSAIATGGVDLVLPIAEIPAALVRHARGTPPADQPMNPEGCPDRIIALLRQRTPHDFTLYKPGTLLRRIERRMGLAGIAPDGADRYFELLNKDPAELDLLAKDLLINVTSFFRDPKTFDMLATQIVPELVHRQPPDHAIRIWCVGCSTGEETYSLVMLFQEAISSAQRNVKLQVFASDVDADAVAAAREGFYPATIAAEVSAARLARFFTREDQGYRVAPELRAAVIFTVQDVLADPPFSRIDLISCRNLLIYLRPEAQAKALSLFDFALRDGGILLLGGAETAGDGDGRFALISKSERLYRHVGRGRPGDIAFPVATFARDQGRIGQGPATSRQAILAALCQRLVLEAHAPAAVLINEKHECLYSLGPTDRFLHVAPGTPSHDLLVMARPELRNQLRTAIQRAALEKSLVRVAAGTRKPGGPPPFSIEVQPVLNSGEALLLVCFVETPTASAQITGPITPADVPRVAQLEQELETVQAELHGAIRNLELSSEEQKAINEEALSVQEEYQSTNEELLTSKEELQSLNEELTALNSQLQETLERQRTTSNDMQNILYSTDVATLFLDAALNIRFFTPATRALFTVIPSDVGRPLGDLASLADDAALPGDARAVLETQKPIEREIEARNGAWFLRRIQPYRTQEQAAEGVVITFVDITERRRTAEALDAAKRQAELANVAKSRFLAAASHDLRQPLQSLALIQGLLAKAVTGDDAKRLVTRLDETLGAMSGMLNALLDINQIEAGTVQAHIVTFRVADLLERLRAEFAYHAAARGLSLRVVPCGLSIRSDPGLLEQMIRNLLSNALKYTAKGKVLLGCRRHGDRLAIEIRDTGSGIAEDQLQAIFEEYHQAGDTARDRGQGLGLGLSIVRRFGDLLGHRIEVRSRLGKGSAFAIWTERDDMPPSPIPAAGDTFDDERRHATILVIEDDPELRDLLQQLLGAEGHRTMAAEDGTAALDLVVRGGIRPDLILADYNLPGDLDGLRLVTRLREKFRHAIPVIMLTGDISTEALRDIALGHCVQLHKPVSLPGLTAAIQHLLSDQPVPAPPPPPHAPTPAIAPPTLVHIVDDDRHIREGFRALLEAEGMKVETYPSCESFLASYRPAPGACLLVDAYLPGMSGIELLRLLRATDRALPSIMITGSSDVPTAVEAIRAGASDFIEKPVSRGELLAGIERALDEARDTGKRHAFRAAAAEHIAGLTSRQREIMDLVLAGHPSKNIAADLGLSQRTVENHRAAIMRRTGAKSLPALARLALAAGDETDAT